MRTKFVLLGALALMLCAGAATIPSHPGLDVAKKGGSTPFPPDHFGVYTAKLGGIGGYPPDHFGEPVALTGDSSQYPPQRPYAHGGEHATWFPKRSLLAGSVSWPPHPQRPGRVAGRPTWPPEKPGVSGPFDPQNPDDGTGHGNPKIC